MKKTAKITSLLVVLVLALCVCSLAACGKKDPPTPALTGISINTADAKKEFVVGDTFTAAGVTVSAKYDNGEAKPVNISDCTVSSPDMTTAGAKLVTVTYEGKTASYTVQVTAKHECESVCPVCGKCLNPTCEEEVCKDKCEVEGTQYTFEAEDEHVTLLAGNLGMPRAQKQEGADRTYVGGYDTGATVTYGIRASKAAVATLKLTVSQRDFVVTEKLAIYVNGVRLERTPKIEGSCEWFVFHEVSLGCVNLVEGLNIIAFYNNGVGVNFDKIVLVSDAALSFDDDSRFEIDTANVKKTFGVGEEFTSQGLEITLADGDGEPATVPTDDADLTISSPDMSVAGKKTVTVVYKRFFTASYEINVEVTFEGKEVSSFDGINPTVTLTDGEGGKITHVNGHLDNINNNYGASFEFKIYSPAETKADLWVDIGQRVYDLKFTDTYTVTVNGEPFESETVVPQNADKVDWNVYVKVCLGSVQLGAGPNTVKFTVNGREQCEGKGMNFKSLILATAQTPLKWYDAVEIDASAVKKEYELGQTFDASGLVVKHIEGATENTLTQEDYTLSSPDMLSAGTKTVTVTYGVLTATFEITVSDTATRTEYKFVANDGAVLGGGAYFRPADGWVDGLGGAGALGRTVTFEIYADGDGVATLSAIINTMQKGKKFTELMSVTVNGNGYSSDNVISYTQNNGYVAVEVPVELCGIPLQTGKNTIVFTVVGDAGFWFNGMKLNSTVETEWFAHTLTLDTSAAKTQFDEGDEFTHEGLVVKCTEGGKEVTLTADKYTVSAPDLAVGGSKTVTVTYGRLSATYTVTVVGAPVVEQTFAVVDDATKIALEDGAKVVNKGTDEAPDLWLDGLNGTGYPNSPRGSGIVTFKIHSDAEKAATLKVTMNKMKKGMVFTNQMGIKVNNADVTFDTVIDFEGDNKNWVAEKITVTLGTVQLIEGDNTITFNGKLFDGGFWINGIALETSATLTWSAA